MPLNVGHLNVLLFLNRLPDDSLLIKPINYNPVFGGKSYRAVTFDVLDPQLLDTFYYRKALPDYFEYTDLQDFLSFDSSAYAELIILKEDLPVGGSWVSPVYTGTQQSMPVSRSLKWTIMEKGVSVTISGMNFSDVIKVKEEMFGTNIIPNPLAYYEYWYARGVGLIKLIDRGDPFDIDIHDIIRFDL